MLKGIKIKGLFNRFNYDIKLKPGGITIITGPNGYGKSTILRIINSISNEALEKIIELPFKQIEVSFTDSEPFLIEKLKESIKINGIKIPIQMINNRYIDEINYVSTRILDNENLYDNEFNRRIYLDNYRNKDNILRNLYMNIKRNIDVKEPFLLNVLANLMTTNKDNKEKNSQVDQIIKCQNILDKVRESIGEIKFIREQRLLEERVVDKNRSSDSRVKIVQVIKEIPDKLLNHIKNVMNEHSNLSSKLDSSYPERLFNSESDLDKTEFEESLKEIVEYQSRLTKYELSEQQNSFNPRFDKTYSKALKVYFSDSKEKFHVFKSLLEKLDAFESIVNDKFNSKKIVISKNFGLKVLDDSNNLLELQQLSSGEQEILVLFFQLIFETNERLLLIDEPEISLHIAWQKELLEDFKKIVRVKNGDVNIIISTHSPQIINNNWNIQIDLGELSV